MQKRKFFIVLVIVIVLGYSLWWLKSGTADIRPQVSSPTYSSTSQSSPPTQQHPLFLQPSTEDTTRWNTLVNKYGWSIKYPSSWTAYGLHGDPAEEDEGPTIQGPNNCFESGLRCGTMQILSFGGHNTVKFSRMSPKQFLLDHQMKYDSARRLLAQRVLQVGGEPAYEITFLQTNAGGYPNGQVRKTIAINHKGVIYDIWYYEEFKDRTVIKSVDDWMLTTLFEQIILTFKFTN